MTEWAGLLHSLGRYFCHNSQSLLEKLYAVKIMASCQIFSDAFVMISYILGIFILKEKANFNLIKLVCMIPKHFPFLDSMQSKTRSNPFSKN